MEVVYRAKDGKIFEYEEDCCSYEEKQELKPFENEILMFDFEGDKIDLFEKNICSAYETAECIVLKTDSAAKFFDTFLRRYGYSFFQECGAYIYNELLSEFIPLEKEISILKEKIKRYENILAKVKEE